MSGYMITLEGQDITLDVDDLSVSVTDTLGQGSGAGSSPTPQGRATTCTMNTRLGPTTTAYGAGEHLPPGGPWLVRNGELIVKDFTGRTVFGGFVSKLTDTTIMTTNFTTIDAIDYSTSLQRTFISEVFSGATDVQIILAVMQKYAPWVKLDLVQNLAPSYTFPVKVFRNVSVEQVLHTITGVTGYQVWVDFNKQLHYVSPAVTQTAPFSLSDFPDHITSYAHAVEEYLVDDNSAINRVFFYGGKKTSSNFTQDVSPLANGNNKVFILAYYPRKTDDGQYKVTVNGNAQVVGYATGTGDNNKFKSEGGKADALINPDAKNITFDVAPASGATVLVTYRYELPLVMVVTDEKSHKYYGSYLDGSISDDTIYDAQTAVQRCRVLLVQQSFGLVSFKVLTWTAGLQAGQLIRVENSIRGINGTYIIQQVQTKSYGAGNYYFELTLGAWNWNVVDVVLKLASLAMPSDNMESEDTTVVEAITWEEEVSLTVNWTKVERTMGGYYARDTPVGDGHDAYCGFSSITT